MDFLNPEEQEPINDVAQNTLFYALNREDPAFEEWNPEFEEWIEQLLIDQPRRLLARDPDGSTCLDIAIENNRVSFVRFIISDRFIGAINTNNQDRERLSLIGNKILNNLDKYKNNSVNIAATNNTPEILEILIVSYAMFNMGDPEKMYSFVNNENNKGSTPLWLALKDNHLEIASRLIYYGGDTNAVLKRAVSNTNPVISHLSIVEKLFNLNIDDNHLDINHVYSDGNTPLLLALKNNHLEIASILISIGAYVNFIDEFGNTPLSIATQMNNAEIVNLLIGSGADVNIPDINGNTPLFVAVSNGNLILAQILIESGADVNIPDMHGRTPLSIAINNGHTEIAELLVQNGAMRGGKKRNNKSKKRNNKSKKRNYKKRKTFKRFYNV